MARAKTTVAVPIAGFLKRAAWVSPTPERRIREDYRHLEKPKQHS
jgi:hypothetical protein